MAEEVAFPGRPHLRIGRESAHQIGDLTTVAALSLAAMLGMVSAIGLSPLLPLMAADLGSSVALLGQIIALLNLLAAGLGLILGPLGDQIGPRRLLIGGLVAVAAGALISALAPTLSIVLLAAILAALSRAGLQPMAFTIAASRFEGTARRRAISWTQAGVSGATLIGLPLIAGVATVAGWRGALVALALLASAVALLQLRLLSPDDPAARAPASHPLRSVRRAYVPLFGHRPTLGIVGATLLGQFGFWATLTYLSAFLVQARGLTIAQAGLGYSAGGLGLLLGNVIAGGPLGRLPLRGLLIGLRAAQAPLLAGVFLFDLGFGGLVGLMLLTGVAQGASTALSMTLVVGESPAGRATTVALNQSALTLGVALASGGAGLLLALGGYQALGLGLLAPGWAAALLLWWSRPRAVPAAAVA